MKDYYISPENNKPQFHRAFTSKRDFEEAKLYLLSYKPNLDEVIKEALLVATVVSYSRPFTSNNGGNRGQSTRTLKGNINIILNENKEIEFHNKILNLRNEAIVHSDFSKKPVNLIQASTAGSLVQSKKFNIRSEILDYDIKLFLSITEKMINHCNDLMFK